MNNKRGDIMIGLLIGLAVGGVILAIEANNAAQEQANISGTEVHPLEVIIEKPAESALTVFGPAVAGAGIGWVIDELGNDSSNDSGNQRNNNVSVGGEIDGSVTITITGDQDNDTTTEDNDGTDGSYNN